MNKDSIVLNSKLELIEEKPNTQAFAAVSLNPLYQWAKIVVTDDQPNLNKKRIPKDEFENLIKTGLFAPIKLKGEIEGHDEAMGSPIGTISQMIAEGNKVIALAALWKTEKPDEVGLLKEMFEKGDTPNVSWEIFFSEAKEEEDGIEALYGTKLAGLAFVKDPAYAGRTPIIAMSEKNKENLSMDEVEKLKTELSEKQKELATAQSNLEEKSKELETLTKEAEELRKFKADVEAEKEKAEKLETIKKKFSEAQLEKDEKYFAENADKLLSLSEEVLDFMIQELVAFSEKEKDDKEKSEKSSTKIEKIPDFKSNPKNTIDTEDPRELGKLLLKSATQASKK